MGWFTYIKDKALEKALIKEADAKSVANNALQLLTNGLNPGVASTIFINQMKGDPNFNANQVPRDKEGLTSYLQGISGSSIPSIPETSIPSLPETSSIPSIPETFIPSIPDEHGETPLIPEEPEPRSEIPPVDEPPIQEPAEDQQTPAEEISNELEIAEELNREQAGEVLPEDQSDEYEEMDIPTDQMVIEKGLEIVNPIKQKRFSIPLSKLKTLQSSMRKISDYKNEQGQAPLSVRYITQDGRPTTDPVPYQKEITYRDGTKAYYDFVDIILEGDPPNPLGDTVKPVRDAEGNLVRGLDGRPKTKEVIYQLIAYLYLAPVEGYEPKEERFPTYQEAANHAAAQGDPLWAAGQTKKKDAKTGEVFYPSTYRGVWRSVIEPYPNTPTIDDRFKQGNPLDCDHCGRAKRGKSARKKVFVAIEYPAEQLRTVRGERREPTPEEAAKGKQVQIGTKCVAKHQKALDFIHNLEKLKLNALNTEKTGRESDSFGGSSRSPKDLKQVLTNYLAAKNFSPGRRGNWYKRRFGGNFSPSELKKFKSFYFGQKRSDIMKALADGQDPKPFPWGETSDDHEQQADAILNWWKEKEFDPTVDIADKKGLEDNNLISIAMHGQITSKYFEKIMALEQGYNREQRRVRMEEEEKVRAEEEKVRAQEQLEGDYDRAHIDNETFNARRIQEEEAAAGRAARVEELGAQGVTLSDIGQIPTNGEFTSQFENIGTKEGGTGRYSDFKGEDGLTYRVFDKYKQQRREPKYDFQPGETYVLKGRKGEYSNKWKNAPLNGVEVVGPDAPAPEVVPEAPIEPEIAPEAPIDRAPIEDTILGDEDRDKKLRKITDITDYAKQVVETGKTRDTQGEWGSVIPGKAMSPEELIPLYVAQIAKVMPNFDSEEWSGRMFGHLQENGKEGLMQSLNSTPALLRHFL